MHCEGHRSSYENQKALEKLRSVPFEELTTVKKVLGRIKEEGGVFSYQGHDLKKHKQGLTFLKSHYVQWIIDMEACLLNRIQTGDGDTELLTHAVTLLATNGWERSSSPCFGHLALESVCQRFLVPLENSTVDCTMVQEEWDDMVEYGKSTSTWCRKTTKFCGGNFLMP